MLKKCTSVKDANGKFNPQYDENDTQTIECDRIYLSIGQSIEWGNLIDGEAVELGRGNAPQADSLTYQTEQRIFSSAVTFTQALDLPLTLLLLAERVQSQSIGLFISTQALQSAETDVIS